MIAPEYFNNHVSVEGEIIVKSVPNDAGFVLVWNPTTKKISRRTHAEIATDLGVVTDSSWNNITGKKWFKTDGGNDWDNNTLRIQGINGHDAGLTFFRDGIDVGQLIFDGYSFSTKTANGVGYIPIKSSNFIKSDSDQNHVLLGDGNDKPISDFVLSSQLGNYVTVNTIQDINERKSIGGGTNNSYAGAAFEIRGNGSTIYPTLSLHQPGSYAATLSYRGDGFHFMDILGTGYSPVISSGFYKNGSSDSYILTGGGGHKPISDFLDTSSYQVITGAKLFYTLGGNNYNNNSLWIASEDGSDPAITFNKFGSIAGQLKFNESGYHFLNPGSAGYNAVRAGGFLKNGFDDNYILLAGGQAKAISDFATSAQLGNYLNTDFLSNKVIFVNDAISQGTMTNYMPSHDPNKPVDVLDGSLLSLNFSDNWSTQLLGDWRERELYFRTRANGTWNEFVKLYHSGNFNPNNYIPTSHPSYTISNNNINNWLGYLGYSDTRIIKPEHLSTQKLQFGFTSWNNQNNESIYADYLHFGGYQDASGGNQNLIVINKSVFGIRQYQGLFQDTNAYSKFVDYWHSNNFSQQDINNWNNTFNNQGNYWGKSSTAGYVGINASTPFSVLNNGYAQKVYMGGLLVSDAYQDEGNVPANGAYVKGQIATGSHGNSAEWKTAYNWGNHAYAGYLTQSALNAQLGNYATLNGVQTFENTNTFLQSPVIPDGTINSHAVNLGQLYYNDRTFITDSRGAVRPPSFYDDRFAQWDFQHGNDTQVTGDSWQGVLTVAKWSNFDPSHRQEQILFTGDNLKRRTAIDDDTWGPEKTIWDSGNFTPANFATTSQVNDKVNRSGDTMSGALLIGNTNIGKQRVLHLAEPTLLDSYGFNFYTDTSTGLLTLHGLNNGLNNAVPILSANRGNNYVGINKENPTTELDVNGYVASNGFIKNNSSDDYFLMGGGGQLTKYSKEDSYVNSHRDFPDGTLITTNIDYSYSAGDSFLLEIKGNMYGGGIPMDTKVQGYIYADTIINQSGYSTYSDLTTIVAMNINGNLCFWFPRFGYWQGFSVKVIATGGGDVTTVNRVISIDNSPEPAGTKHVKIAVHTLSTQTWVNNQGFLTSAYLNGYVTQSSLNNQLGNYATLNGVQTFNNTNTFNQSPVIPNGTLGTHAVNLNQLLDVAPPYHWNYVGQPAINNRRVLREMTWNNYGNGHTIFDISSGTTPWGASKSNVDAEQPWSPSYPTLVGGNGSGTYGVRVDSARNADNLGGISAGSYATQAWVNTNYIPRSHPVFNITQANINSWNAGTGGGSSHTHFNLSYLNNIDQYLGTGQDPQFGSIRLMDSLGYGLLALEEGLIGGEIGLVDTSNKRFYAGRINEYLKYGSSIDGFEGLNMHFDAQLLCIGREIGNDEDKVQLAGDLSVDTIDIYHNPRQLILNPLYNTDGDVRHSRNAHIYIVTGNTVSLPDKPILGQRIEIFNDSDSYIEVTHGNVGSMFKIPGFCKVTGIAANKGFKFDAKPVDTKQYDI